MQISTWSTILQTICSHTQSLLRRFTNSRYQNEVCFLVCKEAMLQSLWWDFKGGVLPYLCSRCYDLNQTSLALLLHFQIGNCIMYCQQIFHALPTNLSCIFLSTIIFHPTSSILINLLTIILHPTSWRSKYLSSFKSCLQD